ncbi:MAG TPA: DNA-3-methyladenine glycosylase I [Gemmatimonadota bacterium]|nr:DNA-3-methyladenine glycosylase I [Gemmatimonadota bacterium]
MSRERCAWPGDDPLMIEYHDDEWGVPVHDDRKLFEYFVLDAFQAGLSWRTILHKRENFRAAFDGFDPAVIARYGEAERERLLEDAGIVRNRQKIDATIGNAREFLRLRQTHGSFDEWIWQFTGGTTIHNHWQAMDGVPATSHESDAMSAALKSEGFKFVGSTICYAFMQAAGMVNDHVASCFRHAELVGRED